MQRFMPAVMLALLILLQSGFSQAADITLTLTLTLDEATLAMVYAHYNKTAETFPAFLTQQITTDLMRISQQQTRNQVSVLTDQLLAAPADRRQRAIARAKEELQR